MAGEPTAARIPYADIAPALAEYTDRVLFRDVWERPGLSPRDRSLITVSALVALYRTNELPFHLKKALETFGDLAAEPLAERAAAELRASGETARKRDPSTLVQLTPTELRIAQLVSQGMSNKDVAELCWISPRTVAFHLRNVFTKTGVTSRGQLAHLDVS